MIRFFFVFTGDYQKTIFCEVKLSEEKYQAFVYAVKNHYWYQMYIDDLPIWGLYVIILKLFIKLCSEFQIGWAFSGDIQGYVWLILSKTQVVGSLFLAHLSQRLIGELIVYKGIRRPSVRQHFQTTSLKPRSRYFSYFTYSNYKSVERIIVFLFRSDKNSGCYSNLWPSANKV